MTVQDAVDAYLVAGASPERFTVHKFGLNLTTASGDAIWEPGGAYPYLTYTGTALAMRVKAGGNAADTAAGTGARTVTIQGLDGAFAIASETVTLDGANASAATTTTFSRVLRAFVTTAGSGRVNAAAIDIEDSAGGATYARIIAGESQSQLGFLTVPAGYKGFLTQILLATDVASATATVRVDGFNRAGASTVAAPFTSARIWFTELAMSRENGEVQRHFEEPVEFAPLTDIWFRGTPSVGTPGVSVQFTMLFQKV